MTIIYLGIPIAQFGGLGGLSLFVGDKLPISPPKITISTLKIVPIYDYSITCSIV